MTFHSDLSIIASNLMPLLNFNPILEDFLDASKDQSVELVEKFARQARQDYDERVEQTLHKVKRAETQDYRQWEIILGESAMERRFRFKREEVEKVWDEVFGDTKVVP